jgi:ferredoxin-NADP reductase
MERAALRRGLTWQTATVASITSETAPGEPLAITVERLPDGEVSPYLTQELRVSRVPARLLYSARALPEVIYRDELDTYRDGAEVSYTLTRRQPPGWTGYARRIDAALLKELAWPAATNPLAFVCGPTSFVETAAAALVGLGYPPQRVKTERFGATGG